LDVSFDPNINYIPKSILPHIYSFSYSECCYLRSHLFVRDRKIHLQTSSLQTVRLYVLFFACDFAFSGSRFHWSDRSLIYSNTYIRWPVAAYSFLRNCKSFAKMKNQQPQPATRNQKLETSNKKPTTCL
jgi:hypothetical protein